MTKGGERIAVLASLLLLGGCGGGGGEHDAGRDADLCSDHDECDDGVFCNGRELCMPEAQAADGNGCVPARNACMPEQTCDEDADRCLTDCEVTGDADGDSHKAVECGGDDCNDADPLSFPGNPEICDPFDRDEDCDPTTLGDEDDDGDGVISSECCNRQPDGTFTCGDDCNDDTIAQRPGQLEVCDDRDNDCDGDIDEEMNTVPWYPDEDGDGFGASTDPMESCAPVEGRSLLDTDCNDDSAAASPIGTEACDGLDNDCDGQVDEGMRRIPWYPDEDGDGFGATGSEPVQACAPVAGHSMRDTDCRDDLRRVHPLASERCNRMDDDCDGAVDEGTACTDSGAGMDGGAADGGAADAGADGGTSGSACLGSCPMPDWVDTIGGGSIDQVYDAAITTTNNVVVVGSFQGTVDFGGGAVTSAGGDDGFIVAYDAMTGTYQWSTTFGDTGTDRAVAITTDFAGDVYVTGTFQGMVDIGAGAMTAGSGNSAFVAKYRADGTLVWPYTISSDNEITPTSIAVGTKVWVGGEFLGGIDTGTSTFASSGGSDIFLMGFNASDSGGFIMFENSWGGARTDRLLDVAADGSDNVYVTGSTDGMLAFSSTAPITATSGGRDAFAASLDSSGLHRWSDIWGSMDTLEEGSALGLDGAGNLLLGGDAAGSIDLGGGTLSTGPAFLGILDSTDGSHLQSTGLAVNQITSLSTTLASEIIVTGAFKTSGDLGGGVLTDRGGGDGFVAGLDAADFSHIWSYHIGGSAPDGVSSGSVGLEIDAVVVTGAFGNTVDLGLGSETSNGMLDGFVSFYPPGGAGLSLPWKSPWPDRSRYLPSSAPPWRNLGIGR